MTSTLKEDIERNITKYLYNTFRSCLITEFPSLFGLTSSLMVLVIYECLPSNLDEEKVFRFVRDSLWLFYYLRNHPKQVVAALMFRVSTTTFITSVKNHIKSFTSFDFIDFDNRYEHEYISYKGKKLYVCVDTTDIPIVYQKKWGYTRPESFSVKNHQYSVKLEVACTLNGEIVWYNGIFFHTHADITIYRLGLKGELDTDEGCFADKGYIGENSCIVPIKKKKEDMEAHEIDYNAWVGLHRAIIENINADLMSWDIMKHYKDQDLHFLRQAATFICNLVNLKRKHLDLTS